MVWRLAVPWEISNLQRPAADLDQGGLRCYAPSDAGTGRPARSHRLREGCLRIQWHNPRYLRVLMNTVSAEAL
jgi:hypothetical protein